MRALRPMRLVRGVHVGLGWLLVAVIGCGGPVNDPPDSGAADDAGLMMPGVDAGFADAGFADAGFDAGFTDAGFTDAGFADAGFADAGFADAGFTDAGFTDAGFADAGFTDAGFTDAGFTDAGFTDAGTGDAWRLVGSVPPGDFFFSRVVSTNAGFLAVGGRQLANDAIAAHSTDGVTWILDTLPTTMHLLNSVAWNGSDFVAAGAIDLSGRDLPTPLWHSTDGTTWTPADAGVRRTMQGVKWTGNRFWAVGDTGVVVSSTNGLDWTTHDAGVGIRLYDLVSRGDVLVAVGTSGTILTSADGVAWSAAPSNTTESLSRVTLEGSTFIVVGSRSTVLTSGDAVTWTSRVTPSSTAWFRDVATFDGGVVAVGLNTSISSRPPPILVSTNGGVTWSPRVANAVVGQGAGLLGVAPGHGKLVGVGSDGVVFSSP